MKKILVTYASRTGSTRGVAETIAKALASENINVDVLPMDEVADLSFYDAVVAGSAIHASAWLPEALEFIRTNQMSLSQKPISIFSVCMTLALANGEKYRSLVTDFVRPVREMIKPVSEAQFAGVLDLKKLPSIGDRIKFGISVLLGVWKQGDHRDWKAIQTWADSLPPLVLH